MATILGGPSSPDAPTAHSAGGDKPQAVTLFGPDGAALLRAGIDGQSPANALQTTPSVLNAGLTLDRARAAYADALAITGIPAAADVLWNGTAFDRARAAYADALAATGIEAAAEMLWNGATFDRARAASQDAMAATGIGADAAMLWNGTAFDRKRGVIGDAQAAAGIDASVPMVWNGASYDRLQGRNGAQWVAAQTPVQTNLVASATQTATFNSSDFTLPSCVAISWLLFVTAISGTTPTVSMAIQVKGGGGQYFSISATSNLTAVGGVALGTTWTSAPFLTYRIQISIGGTTPSVTFYIDTVVR